MTDYQIALVAVMSGVNAETRRRAGAAGSFTQAQRRALFVGDDFTLTLAGIQVSNLARHAYPRVSPAYAGLLIDVESTLVGGGTPQPPLGGGGGGGRDPGVPLSTPQIMVR